MAAIRDHIVLKHKADFDYFGLRKLSITFTVKT